MEKSTFSFNVMWLSVVLLSVLSVRGMENGGQLVLCSERYDSNDCFLLSLPNEILRGMQPVMETITFLMNLSITCKKFNALLTCEEIGRHCKDYAEEYKNGALLQLIQSMVDKYDHVLIRYGDVPSVNRLPILALICAGANQKWDNLLETAVINNDVYLAKMIFKYNVTLNLNIKKGDNNAAELAFKVLVELFREHGGLSIEDFGRQRFLKVMDLWKGQFA
jgi:hypothetical protein